VSAGNTYRILITGAGSGFGKLTAETLARAGHRVFAGMRAPGGRNHGVATELVEKAPGAIEIVDLDVTDDRSAEAAVARATERAGGLDVLVNNAGVASLGISEAFTTEQARALFDVNVLGVHRMNRAALPALRRSGGGLVIHLSSTLGRYLMPFLGLYTASKFAVEALAEAYRYELAPLGIEAVLVQPGTFPTRMLATLEPPADTARLADYGPQNELLAGMSAGLAAAMSGPAAPDPQAVADAVLHIVSAPPGERPARTVVDPQGGAHVEELNRHAAEVQAQVFGAMGLSHLLQVAPRR
jgi:NAD(P)-dependent dehydrogenase (short-subunit alcohol dehydrogenase family)